MTRKIFEVKTDRVAVDWKKLHIAELHDFCSSPNIKPAIK
jgi:hypothetical protein